MNLTDEQIRTIAHKYWGDEEEYGCLTEIAFARDALAAAAPPAPEAGEPYMPSMIQQDIPTSATAERATPDDIALPEPQVTSFVIDSTMRRIELHTYTANQLRTAVLEDRKRREADGVVIDAYAILRNDVWDNEIRIQRTLQRDDSALWKVTDGNNCLNKFGKWEYEPLPSSRDDEFLARCRFATAKAAIDAALAAQEGKTE